jgi:DNA-binding LacI/PurR family transcriptional regulator
MKVKPPKRATLKDIAHHLRVAPSTISNAYNRPDKLSKELRQLVFRTAKEMGYTGPHPVARGLRQQRMGVIGVLFNEHLSYAFSDPAAVIFMQGVSYAIELERFGLTLVPVPYDAPQGAFGLQNAAVDGFVAYCLNSQGLVEGVLERGFPLVLVDHTPHPDIIGINVNDQQGAQQAARHLLSQGHTQIGILTLELSVPPRVGWVENIEQAMSTIFEATRGRMTGYLEELLAAQLVLHQDILVYECSDSFSQGQQGLREIMKRNPKTTSILAMSDVLAFGALEETKQLGIDIAVIGFDDVPQAARIGLSSVSQPHFEKGKLAGELLIRQLNGKTVTSPERFATELIIRNSSQKLV